MTGSAGTIESKYGVRTFLNQYTGERFDRPIRVEFVRPTLEGIISRVSLTLRPDYSEDLIPEISKLIQGATAQEDPNATDEQRFYRMRDKNIARASLIPYGETAARALVSCFGLTPRPGLAQFPAEVGGGYTQLIEEIGASAIPALMDGLVNQEFMVRFRSVDALGRMYKTPSQVFTDAMISMLEGIPAQTAPHTEEADLVGEIDSVLDRLALVNRRNEGRLENLLSHPNPLVQRAADRVLG